MRPYPPQPLRVFLLDDHDIVRRGLSDLMSAKRDIIVVGDTGSAAGAAARIIELEPDVMVLDVHLQDGSGVQVCRDVRAAKPQIRGVIVTAAADDDAQALAMLAGAAGHATKLSRSFELVELVRRVGAGDGAVDRAAALEGERRLLAAMETARPPLTFRERRMVSFLVSGLTDAGVANRLGDDVDVISRDIRALIERVVAALV